MKNLAALITAVVVALVSGSVGSATVVVPGCTDPGDPSVWLVKAGGFWRAAGKFGHYRVVIRREGVEHPIDRAELQILVTNDKAAKREIATCTDLKTPGLKGYVEDITFKKVDDKVTAITLDISMKAMNDVVLREMILASYRGKVQHVVDAPSMDLQDAADRLGSQ